MSAYILLVILLPLLTARGQDQTEDLLHALEMRYEYVEGYDDEGFCVVGNEGKLGLVNSRGREIVPCVANKYISVVDGFVKLLIDDRYGLYDTSGHEILQCVYQQIMCPDYYLTSGQALISVKKGGQWGMTDIMGKVIIPFEYSWLSLRDNGLVWAHKDSDIGVLSKYGEVVVPIKYKRVDVAVPDGAGGAHYFVVQDRRKLWGVADSNGSLILNCVYESIVFKGEGMVAVKKPGVKRILMRLNGVAQILTRYDSMDYRRGFYIVSRDGKWGVLDREKKQIIPLVYERLQYDYPGRFKAKKGDKWGIIDTKGEVLCPFVYDGFCGLHDFVFGGRGKEVVQNGRHGYLDSAFKEVVPCKYDQVEVMENGKVKVRQGEHWGVADNTLLVPCQYEKIIPFAPGFYIVMRKDEWSIIKEQGGEKVGDFFYKSEYIHHLGFSEPTTIYSKGIAKIREKPVLYIDTNAKIFRMKSVAGEYTEMGSFSEGLARVMDNQGYWGFINNSGKEVIGIEYDWVGRFTEGRAAVCKNGKCGYVNEKGVTVIPLLYTDAHDFRNGVATVQDTNRKWGLVNNMGEFIFDCKYNRPVAFSEGMCPQYEDDAMSGREHWFFMDTLGDKVFELESRCRVYDGFSEGLAIVYSEGRYYYVRKNGERAKNERFDKAYPFVGGKACVASCCYGSYGRTKTSIIDKDGNTVESFGYEGLHPLGFGGRYAAERRNGWGLIDSSGKVYGRFRYEKILPDLSASGLYAVQRNGKWGFINREGVEVISIRYDEVLPFRDGLAATRAGDYWYYLDVTGEEQMRFRRRKISRYFGAELR